jgi:hypothetical protein
MKATKKSEQRQDCQSKRAPEQNDLDERYGEIGISAVAAAVRHQPKRRSEKPARRLAPQVRD